jgi:hypothetical protein
MGFKGFSPRHSAAVLLVGLLLGSVVVSPASADEAPAEAKTYLLSLGGHALLTPSEVCDGDGDVVGCAAPFFAAGLDLGALYFPKPTVGIGGRFAMSTSSGATSSTYSHRQWLLRLLGDVHWDSGGVHGGPSVGFGLGAALLLDRLLSEVPSADGVSTMPSDRHGSYLAPIVSVSVGYDFDVFEQLLFGVILRTELMYLAGVNTIDVFAGTSSVSTGLTPLVELAIRFAMTQ